MGLLKQIKFETQGDLDMGASTKKTVIFEAPIDKVYEAITSYQDYPDFVEGVSSVNVLEKNDSGARVEYSINMIKKIRYILKMIHNKPHKVEWSLESGDLFKINSGAWELTDKGDGKTQVDYTVEIDIKGFIPMAGKIVTTLTETQLPKMLKSYEQKAQSL